VSANFKRAPLLAHKAEAENYNSTLKAVVQRENSKPQAIQPSQEDDQTEVGKTMQEAKGDAAVFNASIQQKEQ
jgi:hypothetical protein